MQVPEPDESDLARQFESFRSRLRIMVIRRLDPRLQRRIGPDEVLQESWLAARRKFAADPSEPDSWCYSRFYRITLDTLIEVWRRETRSIRDIGREMRWPEESSLMLGMQCLHEGTTPSEACVRDELQTEVRNAVEQLSESDREVLWMRHQDDLNGPETAAVLGISVTAANVRYFRALKRLRELWTARQKGTAV